MTQFLDVVIRRIKARDDDFRNDDISDDELRHETEIARKKTLGV